MYVLEVPVTPNLKGQVLQSEVKSMTKKRIDISIEEEVLEKARKSIPNLSAFIEECLKNYLGIDHPLIPTHTLTELNETIARAQLEIHLLNEKTRSQEHKEEAEKFLIDKTWRLTFREYYQMKGLPDEKIKESAETLGVTAEEFKELLQLVSIFRNDTDVDLDEWDVVLEAFRNDKII